MLLYIHPACEGHCERPRRGIEKRDAKQGQFTGHRPTCERNKQRAKVRCLPELTTTQCSCEVHA